VTLASTASGQGDGAVQFTVATYADPAARATGIIVEDQRLQVSQEGRPCTVRLSSTLETVEAAGGERTVHVDATSANCRWTVAADVPWITIVSAREGNGSGAVGFRVDAVGGPPRSGTITIGGQVVRVEQGRGCSYTVAADTFTLGAAGGTGEVQVSAPASCAWTAQSQVGWITLAGNSNGSGPGIVRFRVDGTDGPLRTGTLTVAGRVVSVTQSPGCTFVVEPLTYSLPAAGGTGTLAVRAAPGCAWTAATASDWIVFNAGQAGRGDGELRFSVAPHSGPARSGVVSLAGQSVTVTQASGCTFRLTPSSVSIGAAATAGTIQVAAPQACSWSAMSTASWIMLGDAPLGTGNGQVQVSYAANPGPARQASLTIGGHTIPVAQASGCTYSVSPAAQDVAGTGGAGAVVIATAAGCPWMASSHADWVTVNARSGVGPGQVPFTVAPNLSPARTGTLTVADRVVTVSQASSCTWVFSPPYHAFDASGGNGNVLVIVSGACSWTASSDVEWIVLTAGGSGTGGGLVQFVAAPNSGAARTGSLKIAGQRYEVVQGGR
jgi:hypothetical protein